MYFVYTLVIDLRQVLNLKYEGQDTRSPKTAICGVPIPAPQGALTLAAVDLVES
jgi:hypothetical protein